MINGQNLFILPIYDIPIATLTSPKLKIYYSITVYVNIICLLIMASFFLLSHDFLVSNAFAQSNETVQRSTELEEPSAEPPQEQEDDVSNKRPEPVDPIAVITGPDAIQAGETVTLNADDSYDPDGGDLGYSWTYEPNINFQFQHDSESSLEITALPSLDNQEKVTVSLIVMDDEEDQSEPDTKVLEAIPGSNRKLNPIAIAEVDETDIEEGETIELDGYSYDSVDNSSHAVDEYEWTQVAGPQVNFSDQEAETSFTAPPIDQETVLTFSLYVYVEGQESEPDSVSIVVRPTEPEFPVAVIDGPDRVKVGESITLDGRGSFDPEGKEITTYEWTQTGGDPENSLQINLPSDNSVTTSFTAPIVERNEVVSISLRVTSENGDESLPSTKQVAIIPTILPTMLPIAIIDVHGRNTVPPGSSVTLDGRGSYDPEGKEITGYRWTSSDSEIQLSGPSPTVTIPSITYKPFYEFSLVAISDNGESIPIIEHISVEGVGLLNGNCQSGYLLSLESLGLESPSRSLCIPGKIIPWVIGITGVIIAVVILTIKRLMSKRLPKEDKRSRAGEGMDVKVRTHGDIES